MPGSDLKVLGGADARAWIAQESNVASWEVLLQGCSWGTPFQSPVFAKCWLANYADSWQPVLVIALDAEGRLQGLLPLAMQAEEITGIGSVQAEYQGWLCTDQLLEQFPGRAINLLLEHYPNATLKLRYMDFGARSEQVRQSLQQHPGVLLQNYERPLLKLDAEKLSASLKKKSNKSKWNRLKRLGELRFIVEEGAALDAAALDDIIPLYDFRQGAVNGSCPFTEDSRKKPFHQQWMQSAPGQLLLFRLLLGDRTIGAMLGVVSGDQVSNAIMAHCPELASHSPGKFVVYLAGQELSKRGYKWLDLTPGGDPWKDRFADTKDSVLALRAWGNPKVPARIVRREKQLALGKAILQACGLRPSQVRKAWQPVASLFSGAPTDKKSAPAPGACDRFFRISRERVESVAPVNQQLVNSLRMNHLPDLLLFDCQGSRQQRSTFLAAALARLERGQQCFTAERDGGLMFCAWIAASGSAPQGNAPSATHRFSSPGREIYDVVIQPAVCDQALLLQLLMTTMQQCVSQDEASGDSNDGAEAFYLSVATNNGAVLELADALNLPDCELVEGKTL